jgi:hypothetical protein
MKGSEQKGVVSLRGEKESGFPGVMFELLFAI